MLRHKRYKNLDLQPPPKFVPPPLLVVFDPGGKLGYAVFVHGRLVACGHGKHRQHLAVPVWKYSKGGIFLVERPKSYPGKKSKQDPNALMQTDFRAGELTQLYRMCGYEVEEVCPPNAWKGTIGKPEAGEQYEIERRVLERLDEEELELLYQNSSAKSGKLDDNMIDAIGIGLWRLRRWMKKYEVS